MSSHIHHENQDHWISLEKLACHLKDFPNLLFLMIMHTAWNCPKDQVTLICDWFSCDHYEGRCGMDILNSKNETSWISYRYLTLKIRVCVL